MKILVSFLMIIAFSYVSYEYGWPYLQKLLFKEPERRLAPDGVFFLVEKFSHVTEEGIVALHPGTQVTLVQDSGALLTVSDGSQKFEIPREKLSNDLDVRDAALKGDRALKAKFEAELKQLDNLTLDQIKADIANVSDKISKLSLEKRHANVIKDRFISEFSEKYKSSPYQTTGIRNDEQRKRITDIQELDARIKLLGDEIVDLELLIDRKEMEMRKFRK